MDSFAKAADIVVVVMVMAVVDKITIVGIIDFIMLRLVYNLKLGPDLIILYFHLFTNII